jgi:hypothetical protein
MCRFLCVHSVSSQVSGIAALLSLSKKKALLVPPHFRLPSFRMQWHSCSFRAFEGRNGSGSERHRHSYLCITTRRKSQTNSPEMNTSKTKEFKSPEMNTCRKMRRRNGDVSLFIGHRCANAVITRSLLRAKVIRHSDWRISPSVSLGALSDSRMGSFRALTKSSGGSAFRSIWRLQMVPS